MKNWRLVLILFVLGLFISYPVWAGEVSSWQSLVQRMKEKVEVGNLGKEFSLIFYEKPHGKVLSGSFRYILQGDGKVFLQIGDKKQELRLSSDEILWLCKLLLKYKLADLPDTEECLVEDAAIYFLTLRVEDTEKRIYLYCHDEDETRLILWQYLFRFGQTLLEKAELRNTQQPILPIWKGVSKEEKIDSNQDGLIDWLHVYIEFYAFRPGSFIVGYYPGGSQKIPFLKGDTHKEFFINGYELRHWEEREKHKSKGSLIISSHYGSDEKAEVIEAPLWLGKYKPEEFRITPDLIFKNMGKWEFRVYPGQTVFLRMKSSAPLKNETFWWFSVEEIFPEKVKLNDAVIKVGEREGWSYAWYLTTPLTLLEIKDGSAVFEIGWEYKQDEWAKFQQIYKSMLDGGEYKGTKKEVEIRESLKDIEDFEKKLKLAELEITITYSKPPVEKISHKNRGRSRIAN